MNKYYDDYSIVKLETEILDFKDGYYAFKDTIFYGNKGGMLSDKGTINGLEVLDLKYEGDKLYHKVNGSLNDPIIMKVDYHNRKVNTSIQSALHILDGYYEKMGYYIPSVGVEEDDQWYEVNIKNLEDKCLKEVEDFMSEVIESDIKVKIDYVDGKDYPDEKYQSFDKVRIVSFGNLNSQPCGTLHVNSTKDIKNFVVLSKEKTSRGTKIHIACGESCEKRLKDEDKILKESARLLGTNVKDLVSKVSGMVENTKLLKKEIDSLKEENIKQRLNILDLEEKVFFFECKDQGELRVAANILADRSEMDHIIYSLIDGEMNLAVSSKRGNARNIFKVLQESYGVSGGGSPKVAIGKSSDIELISKLDMAII